MPPSVLTYEFASIVVILTLDPTPFICPCSHVFLYYLSHLTQLSIPFIALFLLTLHTFHCSILLFPFLFFSNPYRSTIYLTYYCCTSVLSVVYSYGFTSITPACVACVLFKVVQLSQKMITVFAIRIVGSSSFQYRTKITVQYREFLRSCKQNHILHALQYTVP